jgi:uncharacterized membrane protein (DUF106 family)
MSLPLQEIPFSTLLLFGLAASISFLTSLANRLLTDPKKSKVWRKEISEWNSELRKAQRAGDKKTVEKLMKKQQHILQLQSKMSWQQLKVTFLFFIPLLIIWSSLGSFFAKIDIAYFPGLGANIQLPLLGWIVSPIMWWYLLSSFFFGTVFSHVLGLIEVSD